MSGISTNASCPSGGENLEKKLKDNREYMKRKGIVGTITRWQTNISRNYTVNLDPDNKNGYPASEATPGFLPMMFDQN